MLPQHPVIPSENEAPQWHVLGAGAMGCLWACALAEQNHVHLLLREAALQRYPGFIRQHLESGITRDTPMPASLPASLPAGCICRLLVCCKAQDAALAIASVEHALATDCVIVLLQNGREFQQILTDSRPAGTVFCLSTSAGAWLRKAFVITPAGRGQSWLGHLDTRQPATTEQQTLELLTELPAEAMNIRLETDMSTRLWEKLAVNCAINGLTVIHDCSNGELLNKPAALSQLTALCQEISSLYARLPHTPNLPALDQTVQAVARGTANNISSTLQDIRRGKPTEIDHFNGFLVRLAKQHKLPCPLNQEVLEAVHRRSQATMLESAALP